ncbi:MAG: threonine/serine dehydratase [Gemmatimonadota bacterium]
MDPEVAAEPVRAAARRLRGRVHRTPVHTCRTLDDAAGTPLALKCESLQKTGSYKVRGALNRALTLPPETLARGLVTVSAGNHAQAVAWAAARSGTRATVVMPASAPRAKVEGARGYGAQVVLVPDAVAAFAEAERLAREEGYYLLHPFDDPHVIAGQGTVGMEILEQVPGTRRVVVPIGGGGLIAGIATWFAALRPEAEIWGVEPVGAAAMRASLDRGQPVRLERVASIADGLAAPMAGQLTYPIVRAHVREVVTVEDTEIGAAMRWILERAKLVVEPAGAAALAAVLSGRIPVGADDAPTVVVLSGGNVDPDRIPALLAGG